MEPNDSSRITYDTDQWSRSASYESPKTSKVLKLIIKYSGGYIKNETQATYVVVIFAIVGVIFFFRAIFHSKPSASNKIVISPNESVGSPQGLPQK